jgi:hypothetical protein
MDYQFVTEHTLDLDAVYDWKFNIMGITLQESPANRQASTFEGTEGDEHADRK